MLAKRKLYSMNRFESRTPSIAKPRSTSSVASRSRGATGARSPTPGSYRPARRAVLARRSRRARDTPRVRERRDRRVALGRVLAGRARDDGELGRRAAPRALVVAGVEQQADRAAEVVDRR